MLGHVLDRARARPSFRRLAVLALALAGLGALGVSGGGEDTTRHVRAAGAGIQAAEVPTTAVGGDTVQRAADRRTVEAVAQRQVEVHAGTAEAKRRRYAVAAPAGPRPAAGTTVWDRLARCESGGDWATSAGPHEGGLQFHPDTWDRHRPARYPDAAHHASREQQIHVAERILADQGWSAWPACARQLGLR